MNLIFDRKQVAGVLICLGILFPVIVRSQAATVPYVPPASWSPDGSKIALVVGNSVEVRDAATTEVLYLLSGHTDRIPMVAWSPDSNMIATPSGDQTVKLWNASDGSLVYTLSGQNDSITNVTWAVDGSRLVSSGVDTRPSLFLWDTQTGSLISTHNGGTVFDAAFSPDGKMFAVSNSLSFAVLDAITFEVIAQSPRVECCANQMYSVTWSLGSNTLVTGSINGLVTVWDANTAQMLRQFQANSHYAPDSRDVDNLALSWVRTITFGAGGKTILAASGDGTVREWDSSTGTLVQEAQITPFFTAAWSPYGGRLAVWGPNAQETALFSNEEGFDASQLTGTFRIVVPAPSMERLQAIADACNAPATITQSLTADVQADQLSRVAEAVETLPEGTIPSACAADLIAVAEALGSP